MLDSYAKVLTKNDIGETGSHQAGIAVPKSDKGLLNFFPVLNLYEFNPDAWLTCIDPDGDEWRLRFIYYNGKTFTPPRSTRNEYRITHMTKFFSKWGARSGDLVVLTKLNTGGFFKIFLEKNDEGVKEKSEDYNGPIILRGWSKVY